MKSKISFIGAGNLSFHLANAFDLAGYTIHQIISRNENIGKNLAKKYSAFFDINPENIAEDSDFVFITVPDNFIEEIVKKTITTNPCFVHCAGSISLSAISNYKTDAAIFYPLQSFTKNRKLNYFAIPVFIEASNNLAYNKIKNLANDFSNQVEELSSEKRRILHLAAVISNNFTNHLLSQSEHLLKKADMPIKWLKPLLEETVSKAFELGPEQSQTGPAKRHDELTINTHLEILQNETAIKEIYKIISEQIKAKY
ncbi:MAG: DUF2520 domain-containing protein [Bacteroidetes bacterium]|nr:DUF2520 domain-containing protein [Bacteroidota bacterium]